MHICYKHFGNSTLLNRHSINQKKPFRQLLQLEWKATNAKEYAKPENEPQRRPRRNDSERK